MIKVSFDAPTLSDAVGKAARVAPNKGAAYDRAAGILIEVDPVANKATLKSTNLDLTYMHHMATADGKGDATTWRIPSAILAGLVASLPMGDGSKVTFHDKGDGAIRITAGNTAAKILTLDPETFPQVSAFDLTLVSESQDFASKVAQVSWACAKDGSILSGVHIDGESLLACDRNGAAIVPCKVPITEAVTVPLFLPSPVLRQATDVRVGAGDNKLLIMLDAESQATGRIMEGEYPNVKALRRDNFTGFATVNRQAFSDIVDRLMVMGRSERLPSMTLEFQPGLVPQLVLDLNVDAGRIQDRMDIGGEFDDDFKIHFTPHYIVSAINNARGDTVRLDFGNSDRPDQGHLSTVRVTDDEDYEALVMPRRPGATS